MGNAKFIEETANTIKEFIHEVLIKPYKNEKIMIKGKRLIKLLDQTKYLKNYTNKDFEPEKIYIGKIELTPYSHTFNIYFQTDHDETITIFVDVIFRDKVFGQLISSDFHSLKIYENLVDITDEIKSFLNQLFKENDLQKEYLWLIQKVKELKKQYKSKK